MTAMARREGRERSVSPERASIATVAIHRYPRRGTVSMNRGVLGVSCKARRRSETACVSVFSVTATRGQSASSNSSFVTRRCGRLSR